MNFCTWPMGIHLVVQNTTCYTWLTTHLVHSTLEWKHVIYNIQMSLIQTLLQLLFIHTYITFCSATIHRLTQENYTGNYCIEKLYRAAQTLMRNNTQNHHPLTVSNKTPFSIFTAQFPVINDIRITCCKPCT
jgi:hypothetical protein